MLMSPFEAALTIGLAAAATITTRFAPFLLIPSAERAPHWVRYLGRELAPATFILLVVYCLKSVNFADPRQAISTSSALIVLAIAHRIRHNMMVSMAAGIVCYMLLLRVLPL